MNNEDKKTCSLTTNNKRYQNTRRESDFKIFLIRRKS